MQLKDFKLDSTNDIVLNEQNDFTFVEGEEEVIQALENILQTNIGEWFLNIEFGTDLFSILGQNLDQESIELIISEALYNDTRVQRVENITTSYNQVTRELSITCNVDVLLDTDVNKTITIEVVNTI